MEYTKTDWKYGDIVSEEGLNNIEDAIDELAKSQLTNADVDAQISSAKQEVLDNVSNIYETKSDAKVLEETVNKQGLQLTNVSNNYVELAAHNVSQDTRLSSLEGKDKELQENIDKNSKEIENVKTDLGNYVTKTESNEFSTKEDLSNVTSDMATQTWVNQQNFLKEHQSLNDYAKKEDLTDLATKTEVESDINTATKDLPTKDYVKTTIDSSISKNNSEINNKYPTRTEVARDYLQIANVDVYVDMYNYAKKTWVEAQGYLKEHQSLDNYVTDAELTDALAALNSFERIVVEALPTDNIKENAIYVLIDKNKGTATEWMHIAITGEKEWVRVGDEDFDISNYYTKEEVDSKIRGTVNGLASEIWVQGQGYAKSSELDSKYQTKTEASDLKAEIESDADSKYLSISTAESDYAKKEELPDPSTYATKEQLDNYYTKQETSSEISSAISNSTSGMATQTWVESQNYLKEHQSLDGYAKKTDLTPLATIDQVNNAVTDMATQTWVNQQGFLTSHQSLDDYAKKDEIASTYVSNEELAKKRYVTQPQSGAANKEDAVYQTILDAINGSTLDPDSGVGKAISLYNTNHGASPTNTDEVKVALTEGWDAGIDCSEYNGVEVLTLTDERVATRQYVISQGYLKSAEAAITYATKDELESVITAITEGSW